MMIMITVRIVDRNWIGVSNMIDEKKIYNYIKSQINPYGKPFEGTTYEFGLKIMNYIENMEKVGEWIPCSERLPDNYTNVIACFATGTVTELRYIGGGVFSGIYEYNTEVITAWQPLPDPYQPGKG